MKLRKLKHLNGVQQRQYTDNDSNINKQREKQLVLKERLKENGGDGALDVPQKSSFRYVDMFSYLNCAEDLLKR